MHCIFTGCGWLSPLAEQRLLTQSPSPRRTLRQRRSSLTSLFLLAACSVDQRDPNIARADVPPPERPAMTAAAEKMPPLAPVKESPSEATSASTEPLDVAPVASQPGSAQQQEMPATTPPTSTPPASTPAPETASCRPALGVSGAPTTIPELLVLLNSLPKPTSLACFLEALERPLTVYMTESNNSLQPSPGPRSPRTFILRSNLELSIVPEGDASNTLLLGFRPEPSRSIKAQIDFPLTGNVSEATLFERSQQTPTTSSCGSCHVDEVKTEFPGFPSGVFESDVFPPFDMYQVSVASVRAEAASCDAAVEAKRCELLSALYDHGEVEQGQLRGPE